MNKNFKKNSISCIIIKKYLMACIVLSLSIVVLCSCQSASKEIFNNKNDDNYKEAEKIDYNSLYSSDAILLFKSDLDNSEIGELYIKMYDKPEEKIADNVKKFEYSLLNDNSVIYIDKDNDLYLKKYAQDAAKIDKNVYFGYISISAKNDIYYVTYDDDDFYENLDSEYREILLDNNGNLHELFNSKNKGYSGYGYASFSDNGKYTYILNNFGLLSRIIDDGEIEKIAGNVNAYAITPDGTAFAYTTYNDRLYIKWSGAKETYNVKSLDIYEVYELAENGLSCIAQAYDDENYSIIYVSPFNEPFAICESQSYLTDINNEYIYFLDDANSLYGCKLPKITSNTNSEELSEYLSAMEKHFIGSNVSKFAVSSDGKSVSYISDENYLYTSYEMSEAVKVKENIVDMQYISNAVIFLDGNSKLYINSSLDSLDKISTSIEEIADIENYHSADSRLDKFVYVDKNFSIYSYSVKEKSRLIADNADKYTHIADTISKALFLKQADISGIAGIYNFENASNSYDNFSAEIMQDSITVVYDEYYFKSDIYFDSSTENSISFSDYNGYTYTIDDNDGVLSLEIYDAEMDSYYQYKVSTVSREEYDKRLEEAKINMKYNEVYSMIEDYYYNDYYAEAPLPMYADKNLNSEIVAYTVKDNYYFVQDYYVEDNYNFWLHLETEDGYAWVYIDTSNIDL